jgi:hypothetical protein
MVVVFWFFMSQTLNLLLFLREAVLCFLFVGLVFGRPRRAAYARRRLFFVSSLLGGGKNTNILMLLM